MKYSEITLGCDPEFELLDKYGTRYSPELVADSEYDQCPTWGLEVGVDSGSVEIRPNPSNSAKCLVNKFKNAVQKAHRRGVDKTLSVTGLYYCLGGHIHIGGEGIQELAGYRRYEGLTNKELVKLFDIFLGAKVKCLNSPIRCRSPYGLLGNWRQQSHGVEYRSPSSAIFYNELLARYSLVIMKRTVYFYSKGLFKDYIPLKARRKDYTKYLRFTPNQYKTFISEIYKTKLEMQKAYKDHKPLAVKV